MATEQLNTKCYRNQFDACTNQMCSLSDESSGNIIPLRTAVQQEFNCGGHGLTKCNCAGIKPIDLNVLREKLCVFLDVFIFIYYCTVLLTD